MEENETKNEQSGALVQEPPKTRFHAFKYWADVIKWVVNLIGDLVDSVKENPFPKKDDYTN